MDKRHSLELTPELLAESARLAALPDSDIDFSDIPPLTEDFWQNATRGKFYRPVKQQVTLRLDADVLRWFKTKATGSRGYQSRINAALRFLVEEAQRKTG